LLAGKHTGILTHFQTKVNKKVGGRVWWIGKIIKKAKVKSKKAEKV
jgi:hypothetical protein